MKLAHLVAGQQVETTGYYVAGDGGQAKYLIKASQAVDGFSDHELAGTTVAILQYIGPANIKQFGAKVDGAFDDEGAVDSWLDVGLQEVALLHPGGNSLLTTWAEKDIATAINLIGQADARLTGIAAAEFISPVGGDIEIDSMEFNTWNRVISNIQAAAGTTDFLRVINSLFDTISDSAIDHERPINRAVVAHNEFIDVSELAVRFGENTFANQLTRKNIQVLFNRFNNIDGASTASTGASLIYGIDVDIIGNLINDLDQSGTGEAWGLYTKVLYGVIAFNHIVDILAAGNSDNTGISLKGTARGTSVTPNGIGSLTLANVVRDIGASNIRGIGIRSQADEQYIALNFIEDAGLVGIQIDGVDCNQCSSLFNRIVFAVDTGTIGISFAQAGTGLRSIGDEIVNAVTGIRLATDALNDANNIVIKDDMITVTGSAIQTNPAATDINGLLVSGNIVPSASVGMQFNGGDLINNVRLLDNDFRGATTEIGGIIPADIEIRHTFIKQTTDAVATQAISLALPDESLFRIEAKIVGKSADTSERCMYHKTALVYRDGAGAATIQGAVIDTSADVETSAGLDGTITVNGNSARVTVTGLAATTIDWKVELSVLGVG